MQINTKSILPANNISGIKITTTRFGIGERYLCIVSQNQINIMTDKVYQKMYFEAIFNYVLYAPVLEHHPRYCIRQFADLIPYIAYDDVLKSKFIIRGRPTVSNNPNAAEAGAIIVEYANLDDLVNAGWRLN